MLNFKILSARKDGHMMWEISQNLDKNSCGWEQYETYMLCVKDWIQQTVEECKLPQCSLHRIQIRMVPDMSVALRSIVPKIPGELGGRPGVPWGGPHCRSTPRPHLSET